MEGGDGEASESWVAGGVWVEGVWSCDGQGDALAHFSGGFVGEGQREDRPRRGVVGNEMGDPARDDAGLS